MARGLSPASGLDRYLDDPVLSEPFRAYFHPAKGSPSVPMGPYVRMKVLKWRYRPGLRNSYRGQQAAARLNEGLLKRVHCGKVIKLNKARADATVLPADVRYPSDAGLLVSGISHLAVLTGRLNPMQLARTSMPE